MKSNMINYKNYKRRKIFGVYDYGAGQLSWYSDWLRAGRFGDQIPVGARFRGPPSLLYNRYRVFPGGKAAGAWCRPPTLF
jgi:hypothetical protein